MKKIVMMAMALASTVCLNTAAHAEDYSFTNRSPHPSQNKPAFASDASHTGGFNTISPAAGSKNWSNCKTEISDHCAGVKGDKKISACLNSHKDSLSESCATIAN